MFASHIVVLRQITGLNVVFIEGSEALMIDALFVSSSTEACPSDHYRDTSRSINA